MSGTFASIGTSSWTTSLQVENSQKKMEKFYSARLGVDFEFIDMLEIELLEGRSFNREIETDKGAAFLVTETFVKEIGWKDSPINKRIKFGEKEGKIIGVIKDFHYMSVLNSLNPMFVYITQAYLTDGAPLTYIKINSEDKKKTLDFIEKKWKELVPAYPFEYRFLEDTIAEQYDFPKRLHRVFNLFSVLCIIISCLGLFGLSSFVAERRTKEIGIRKVYGATIRGIVTNVSFSFLKLIILSGIIGSIIIDLSMKQIDEFWAYPPEYNIYIINIVVMSIILVIALATVSYHAVKTALTDPINALRCE